MKRKISLFFAGLFVLISASYGQTALEKAIKMMNMSIHMPSYFDISKNEDLIFVSPITEESSGPKLAQTYYFEPSFDSTAFQVFFGRLHSIIRHANGEYLIFVYVAGELGAKYGQIIKDNNDLFNIENLTFNRIKNDFRYGKRMKSASKEEIMELDLMLTHYSEKQAKEIFNADWMVTYPMNLRGEIYEGKYSRCRALVASKEGSAIFFYFMMADENLENFEKYLKDIDKVFWFNEKEASTSKNPVTSGSQPHHFEVDGIYYKFVNNNNVEVTASPNCYNGIVSIPAEVNFNGSVYSVTSIGGGAFIGCSGLTSVILPQSITRIKPYAFMLCNSLESIIIPNSVTQIEESVFSGCHNLKSIAIPDSVTKIKEFAFWECSGLDSIVIPNSVTSIGAYAFYRCRGLKSVIIPNSVEYIMEDAFGQCDALTSVTCRILKPFQIKDPIFSGVKFDNCTLYVPRGKKELYKTTEGWNSFFMVEEI